MGIALDGIIVLIIILTLMSGYRKGFIKMVFRLCGFVVSLICASVFAKPVAVYLRDTIVFKNIMSSVEKKLGGFITSPAQGLDFSKLLTERPERFNSIVKGFGKTLEELQGQFNSLVNSGVENVNDKLISYMISPAANALSLFISFILVFFVVSILLSLLMIFMNRLSKLPILNGFNKFGGAVAGFLIGILYCFVFCLVLQLIVPYISGLGFVISPAAVERTLLYKNFAAFNPFGFIASFFS